MKCQGEREGERGREKDLPFRLLLQPISRVCISKVHNRQLPRVDDNLGSKVKHIWLDAVIRASLEERAFVLDIVLPSSQGKGRHTEREREREREREVSCLFLKFFLGGKLLTISISFVLK